MSFGTGYSNGDRTISAGGFFLFTQRGSSFAVLADESMVAWGANEYGQLGTDGTSGSGDPETLPVGVGVPEPVVAVEGKLRHTLALTMGGDLYGWGWNSAGQLGDGTTISRPDPRQIDLDAEVVAISTGGLHSLALDSSGEVWSWGSNVWGQLGRGSRQDEPNPLPGPIPGLPSVVAIEAGSMHSLALDQDGSVWSWGYNEYAQLGVPWSHETEDGLRYYHGLPYRPAPHLVEGITDVTAIATLHFASYAVTADGQLYGWGSGNLGNGSFEFREAAPRRISGLPDVVSVSTGLGHALALDQDGNVWTWGENDNGQLGTGDSESRPTPTRVESLTGVVGIASGASYSLALDEAGRLWGWGDNSRGQLGDGTTSDSLEPILIIDGVAVPN